MFLFLPSSFCHRWLKNFNVLSTGHHLINRLDSYNLGHSHYPLRFFVGLNLITPKRFSQSFKGYGPSMFSSSTTTPIFVLLTFRQILDQSRDNGDRWRKSGIFYHFHLIRPRPNLSGCADSRLYDRTFVSLISSQKYEKLVLLSENLRSFFFFLFELYVYRLQEVLVSLWLVSGTDEYQRRSQVRTRTSRQFIQQPLYSNLNSFL